MEAKPNKSLAMVLGKFSSLLIKENIINPETDNSALFKAMGNVVHNISQPPVEKKKPVLSSVDFIKGPLANLISKHEKSQNRIEEMRKKKYIEEVSQLKEKPTISSFSKRMNNMPPLHQRTEKLIKDKQKLLERQRNSKKELEDKDIAKSCTFRPTSSSRNSSRSRSPECITKELYKWNERRKKSIDQQRQEKESLESTKLISKPRIDNLSQKLSKIRSTTPVHERLFRQKSKKTVEKPFSFHPQINQNSLSILRNKDSQRSSRAASPTLHTISSVSTGYKINSCTSSLDVYQNVISEFNLSDKTKFFIKQLDNM